MILTVIQSSVILMVGLTAVQIFRRPSAAVRHLILTAAVVAALVVPALPPLSLARHTGARHTGQTRIDSIFPSYAVSNVDEDIDRPLAPLAARNYTIREVVWGTWLAGVGVAAIFFITGAVRFRVIIHRSRPLGGTPWMRAMDTVSSRLGMRRHVRLRQNDEGLLGTYGILRPTVLVSPEAGTWTDDEICIVLTHECAHIQRLDWLIQMLAEISRTLYWFNPLIWIVCRRLRYESELACDDAVLNTGIDPKDYAGHLLNLARAFKNSGRSWSPVVAMAQPPNLERRFLAMLNASVNHRPATLQTALAVCFAAVLAVLPLAAMRPSQATSSRPPVTLLTAEISAEKPALVSTVVPSTPAPPPKRAIRAARAPVQGLADGSVVGKVYDGTGAVIPGVRVTMTNLANDPGRSDPQVHTTVTGDVGDFRFDALVPGEYSLRVESPGFVTYLKRRLEIKSSQTSRENITLSIGNINESMTITATGQPKRSTGSVQRIRVGGNVKAANLISQVKPIYPESAQNAGVEGTVHLQGIIGADGTLQGLRVVSSNDRDLANAALEAVSQWRYQPTLLNNEPVQVLTEIDVEFKLSQ